MREEFNSDSCLDNKLRELEKDILWDKKRKEQLKKDTLFKISNRNPKKNWGRLKYTLSISVFMVALFLGYNYFSATIDSSNSGGPNIENNNTTSITQMDQNKENVKSEQKLEEIDQLLSSFKLPTEGRIDTEAERQRWGADAIDSSLFVYKNGFVIDPKKKVVSKIIHFNNGKNIGEPYGTQSLAYFKTMINSELSYQVDLGEYLIIAEGSQMTKEEALEQLMKEYKKHDNPNSASIGGWDSVISDIEKKIKTLNELAVQLKEYESVNNWIQEAKLFFEDAKRKGVDNWKEAYANYQEGCEFIEKLRSAIN